MRNFDGHVLKGTADERGWTQMKKRWACFRVREAGRRLVIFAAMAVVPRANPRSSAFICGSKIAGLGQ